MKFDIVYVKKYIYVLNMKELRSLCDYLNVEKYFYYVHNDVIKKGGLEKKTVIIDKILKRIQNVKIIDTVLRHNVVCFDKILWHEGARIHYGQYKSTDNDFIKIMKRLTKNKYKNGCLVFDILYEYWTKNIAPTMKQFAKKYTESEIGYHEEWQYINYVKDNGTMKGWKEYRNNISKNVISMIHMINTT